MDRDASDRGDRLRLLQESVAALLGAGRLDLALRGVFEKLVRDLDMDACFELTLDPGGALRLVLAVARNAADERAFGDAGLGAGLCGVAARSGKPVIVNGVQEAPGDDAAVERALEWRAFAAYPLVTAEGQSAGVVAFASRMHDELTAGELAVLETIARCAAAAHERLALVAELRDAESGQHAFLATLAHELRNPLAPIRNALEIMRVNARGQSAVENAARLMIERQLEQMVRLVDDAQRTGLRRVMEPAARERSAAPREPARRPAESDADVHATSHRVLVADDNRDAAESLGMLLRLMGNDVRTVYDGVDAVSEAEAFRPDVVLLDIGMPKLDGYEAARRIREQPWSEGMLLVALTGWGQDEDKRKASEAGFDRYFTKPLDPAELGRLLADP